MSVTREEVLAAISDAKVGVEVAKLRDDIKLSEQGIDSLEIFNILLLVSERFDLDIPDEDTEQLNTVRDILDYLNKRLG
jgi:acyl carrier protein